MTSTSFLPTSRAGKVTIAVLAIFTLAMNPPVIGLVDAPALVFGIDLLYLWTVAWGISISLVLVWAAWRDAFSLTEKQVPPELRDGEGVEVATEAANGDRAAREESR